MTKSSSERVAQSDAKRGYQAKTYKLPIELVARIEQLARARGVTQAQLLLQAVDLLETATVSTATGSATN